MNAVRRLEDFDDPGFDPFIADEAMFGECPDPYARLADLRRKGPVHALNYRVWMGEPPDMTSDRALVPQAIEEALRWDGPVLIQTRLATRDVELGGVKIPAGAFLDVAAGAANRDPQRFPQPDTFDIFRKPEHRHFAFAFGPHVCIGQHLARVEMTRALNAVLDRLPDLRLDPSQPPPQIRGIMMRVPKHIHVRFG